MTAKVINKNNIQKMRYVRRRNWPYNVYLSKTDTKTI
jgi:hypothetical protein